VEESSGLKDKSDELEHSESNEENKDVEYIFSEVIAENFPNLGGRYGHSGTGDI
jgi:hypothetical protein